MKIEDDAHAMGVPPLRLKVLAMELALMRIAEQPRKPKDLLSIVTIDDARKLARDVLAYCKPEKPA